MRSRRFDPPQPARALALREALRRAQMIGPFSIPVVAGLGAGFGASFVVDALLAGSVGSPWRQAVDAIVFVAVAAPTWVLVQRRDVRAAIDVMIWLNGWETERWERELGRRLPTLPRARPKIVEDLPDTLGLRPLRVELLAAGGAVDEARERWAQLPTDTAWQRFEQAALAEWIAFWENEPEHTAEMETLAAQLDDAERAVVARAMVAAARARRAAAHGGDAVGPLATVRPLLGDRPRRYAFSTRTGVVVSVAVIGLIAATAILVTSLLIR